MLTSAASGLRFLLKGSFVIGAMVMSRLLELMIPMRLGRTILPQTKTTTVRDAYLSR
jgi:hypothetical protein